LSSVGDRKPLFTAKQRKENQTKPNKQSFLGKDFISKPFFIWGRFCRPGFYPGALQQEWKYTKVFIQPDCCRERIPAYARVFFSRK
jgi:hypothetical protein